MKSDPRTTELCRMVNDLGLSAPLDAKLAAFHAAKDLWPEIPGADRERLTDTLCERLAIDRLVFGLYLETPELLKGGSSKWLKPNWLRRYLLKSGIQAPVLSKISSVITQAERDIMAAIQNTDALYHGKTAEQILRVLQRHGPTLQRVKLTRYCKQMNGRDVEAALAMLQEKGLITLEAVRAQEKFKPRQMITLKAV